MSDDAPAQRTEGAEIISSKYLAFLRGCRRYREGGPKPENIWPDAEWETMLNMGQCEYLGYMTERGAQLMRQTKLREWAEGGGEFPV